MDTPVDQALPFLKPFCICRKKKKSFSRGLRYALLKKLGIPLPKSEQKMDQNPFLLLGKIA